MHGLVAPGRFTEVKSLVDPHSPHPLGVIATGVVVIIAS